MSKLHFTTKHANAATVQRNWYVVDGTNQTVGRMCSRIAAILRGKNKAYYTPHVDTGDFIIVINAEKVKLTGKKLDDKTYYWHTGYPGGIKERKARKILEEKFPERVLEKAIFNMISRGPLQRDILTKLRVYKGSTHPHEAQNPQKFDVASLNEKNKR